MLGIQKYDKDDKPICAICNKAFHRLLSHVRQKHGIEGQKYRVLFGFCKSFTFISVESKEIARRHAFENYKKVVEGNLLEKGKKTRCYKGHNKFKHVMTKQRLMLLERARLIQKEKREVEG